jgi:tRNA (adenine-N(1)-)-methyltransferase non-catalytic subunit
LIGAPWGSIWELANGKLTKLEKMKELTAIMIEDNTDPDGESRDNRNLGVLPNEETQKLTADDIHKMRSEGASGESIISALVERSVTFKDKTAFSKEKWIKRKQNKYLTILEIIRPTSFTLCRGYFMKTPKKICGLRSDTISQILTLSNVYANQSVICYEECTGLLIGSIAERLAGYGNLFHLYDGDHPALGIVRFFNFSAEERSIIQSISFANLDRFLNHIEDEILDEDVSKYKIDKQKDILEKRESKFRKRQELAELIRNHFNGGVDSIIIAMKSEPPFALIQALFPFLAPSGSLVVYAPYLEYLIPCFQVLRDSEAVVNIRLSETWLRQYQVLPRRTHPFMNMSGGGGYLLTGNKLKGDFGIGKFKEYIEKKSIQYTNTSHKKNNSQPPQKKMKHEAK